MSDIRDMNDKRHMGREVTCPTCSSPVTVEGHTTRHYRLAPDVRDARIAELEKAARTELARCRAFLRGLTPGTPWWVMFNAVEMGLMEAVEPEAYRAMLAKYADPKSEG